MLESEAFEDARVVRGRRWDVKREMIKEKILHAVCALKQGKASSCVFFSHKRAFPYDRRLTNIYWALMM